MAGYSGFGSSHWFQQCYAKVTAHVVPGSNLQAIDNWLAKGNQAADSAARAANADRPQHVWQLWRLVSEQTVQLRVAGEEIRKHLVVVNKRWYERHLTVEGPAVHTPRVANSPTMRWVHPERIGEVRGLFRRYFGRAFTELVLDWWQGLVVPTGGTPQWISFAQLYLDWQLVVRHAGVTKCQRQWILLDEPGAVPEQIPFRKRCKHFRLMIQQFAKDAQIQFATCTGRPASDAFQCHIGCASMVVRVDRVQAVERWLLQKFAQPFFGSGESLDMIPAAWYCFVIGTRPCCTSFSRPPDVKVKVKHFLFSSLFGEMIQFDKHIFQMGLNHQLVNV